MPYVALHEPSGYATAARRCMRALMAAGVDVRWLPLVPGPDWGLGYRPASAGEIGDPALADLLAGPGECDVVVAHLVPEYWPLVRALYPGTPLVGHTVWETDRLPDHWLPLLDCADLVLVPTHWNRDLMERSGVRGPLGVVPHTAATAIASGAFVVYTIAPWTARKGLEDVVCAYQAAFAGRDDTLLVVKSSPRDFTDPHGQGDGPAAPATTAWKLAQVLSGFADPAPVRLVTGELAEDDIEALHTRGDCYLSLCRSEGWGIPPFDAAAWGNPVVITGFGGQLDYLDDDSAYLVDYELVAVDDPLGGMSYTPDQHWAKPSVAHATALLQQVLCDPDEAAARGERARERMLREFAAPVVAEAFLRELAGLSL
jgi:glycosyltransferase involved in cell wall biosynthesis